MQKSAAIIGAGNIARTLQQRLQRIGVDVPLVIRRRSYEVNGETFERTHEMAAELVVAHDLRIDAVFLAIPSEGRGETARDYLLESLNAGIPCITCEKAALAYHAPHYADFIHPSATVPLKFSGAVMGGTQALSYLRSRHLNDRIVVCEAVLNGTLNYIFDEVAHGGRTMQEACDEAIRRKFTEPGASDLLAVINGELRDVILKTCVLYNTVLARNEVISPDDLGTLSLTEKDLAGLSERARSLRLIISFSNGPSIQGEYFDRPRTIERSGWYITIGFRDVAIDPDQGRWVPGSVGNAVRITEGKEGAGGQYTLTGPGAGLEPTTTAMLNDFAELHA